MGAVYSGLHESWPFWHTWGMKAYSKDLRIRVIDAVDRGNARLEVAEQFMVSLRTIKRWLHRRRASGNLAASPRPGPPAVKMGPLRAGLLAQLKAHPAATLDEHCARWEQTTGVRVSTATMSRVITQHFGWTRKKSR
jgi:transposase